MVPPQRRLPSKLSKIYARIWPALATLVPYVALYHSEKVKQHNVSF